MLVDTLLRAGGALKVLTTSRESLRVPGETVWRVPPLYAPDVNQATSVEQLARCAAVELFVDRASGIVPSFPD